MIHPLIFIPGRSTLNNIHVHYFHQYIHKSKFWSTYKTYHHKTYPNETYQNITYKHISYKIYCHKTYPATKHIHDKIYQTQDMLKYKTYQIQKIGNCSYFRGNIVPKLTLVSFLTLSVRNGPSLQSYL